MDGDLYFFRGTDDGSEHSGGPLDFLDVPFYSEFLPFISTRNTWRQSLLEFAASNLPQNDQLSTSGCYRSIFISFDRSNLGC